MATTLATATRPSLDPLRVLRTVTAVDAGVTAANGIAYVALAPQLEDLLGVPSSIVRGLGFFLLGFAVLVAATARQPVPNRRAVTALIVSNELWVVASLVAAATDWHDQTATGTAWIVLQAAVVAGFAVAQTWATRRP